VISPAGTVGVQKERKMKRTLLVVATIAFLVGGTTFAATATSQFQVTATVGANCTITAATLDFAAYDPVGTNATTPLDATGSVSVNCTKGASIWVGLNAGLYGGLGTFGTRAMYNSTDHLGYELYTNAARTTVWGNASGTGASWTSTGMGAHAIDIYGRVGAGQDVSTGSYSDTITATVNF
jgi:spore coat protein U-like protein